MRASISAELGTGLRVVGNNGALGEGVVNFLRGGAVTVGYVLKLHNITKYLIND